MQRSAPCMREYARNHVGAVHPPKVAILLSTFNGAEFLAAQLHSIGAQSHDNWHIHASDDGSSDRTRELLLDYQRQLGTWRLTLYSGPRQGPAANFLSLLRRTDIAADYFAYCDQDDIWEPHKLEKSLEWSRRYSREYPTLYCSRTRLVDRQGMPIGTSPLFAKPASFANALVQSLAGGNTMLFNGRTRELLARVDARQPVVAHDWLTYMVVSGCAGTVYYDPEPLVLYRQHGGNMVGSNSNLKDRWLRIRKMLAGTFRQWNEANLRLLRPLRPLLSTRNQRILDQFDNARGARLPVRLLALRRAGVYRQTLLGNLGLLVAALLNKI